MDKQVRVAVVGAGQIGRQHCRVAAESELTELVALVDADADAPSPGWLPRELRFESLDDAVARARPELVVVATPTSAHGEIAARVLEAGLPVLVEKPIADTVEAAEALLDTARARGVPLAVGHVERFNPAVRELAARLASGQLGRVYQVHTQRLSPFPVRVGDSGVALDMATHDLDVMCTLAGTPLRVNAETDHRSGRRHEDLIAATLRFDSGVIGLLEVNWLTPTKVRMLSVTGDRGMFVVDYLNQLLTFYENAVETEAWFTLDVFSGVTEGDVVQYAIHRVEPLRAQIDSIARAVRGKGEIEVSGEDGLRALRLALAIVESGERGRTVEVV